MKNLIALALLFVSSLTFSSVAFADVKTEIAQIEARQQACLDGEDGQSTVGMKLCVGAAGEDFDVLLNKVYQGIVKSLKVKTSDKYVQADNKEILKRLVASERAWIQFRNADGVLNGINSLGGTLEGLDISFSINEMTKARILQLDNLL